MPAGRGGIVSLQGENKARDLNKSNVSNRGSVCGEFRP